MHSRNRRRTGTRGRALTALAGTILTALLTVGGSPAVAAAYPAPGGGTRQVVGAILGEYRALGGPDGVLGRPLTDELVTPDGRGRYNLFQGGSIYWSPATGAHAIAGAIRDRWAAQGWEAGPLGFPLTRELTTPDLQGRYNLFQGGSIYWSPATGAHPVGGAIRDRWAQLGWENSALGLPVSGERAASGGRVQDFRFGSIRWTPAGGAVVVGARKAGGGRLPLGVTPPGTQAVTVVATSPGATTARLTAWELRAGGWTAVLGPISARIGAQGIGTASEATSRTPAGTFRLTEAFGRQADPGTDLPYRRVDGDDWWVSDVHSPRYNRYARCDPGRCDFDESAAEDLYAAGPVYDHAVVIDYNRGGVPGAGSAFFLHVTNGAATAGCVAVGRADLRTLLRWLDPAATPVISIGVS